MEPKEGQIWYSKQSKTYILLTRVGQKTIDIEYIVSNNSAWCSVEDFKKFFKFVSG